MAGEAGRLTRLALAAAAFGCCAATSASSPVETLAGRYGEHFQNIDGEHSVWSDNVMEVVPVDADHAYLDIVLYFPNGFSCGFAGIAKAEGDALVYRAPAAKSDTGRMCVLNVRHKGTDILLDDGDNSCKDYCGMNASLSDMTLPWKSKRPITYMTKLKNSSTYRDALTEWHTGKLVYP